MLLEDGIAAFTKGVKSTRESLDEASRIRALKAAQGLVEALSSPLETAVSDVSLHLAVPLALRMGVQLGVFTAIRDHQGEGATTQEIAENAGASPLVVEQVLKVLVARRYVLEAGLQLYKPSALTIIMADPVMAATTRATFDVGHPCVTYGAEYFRRNGNQFPTSVTDTPFQLAKNTTLSYFDWLRENPSLAQDFQQFMTIKQQKTLCWVDWFDVKGTILEGAREDKDGGILLVDVGGGEGHYIHAFNRKFPHAPGRRILQDLPHVISGIANPPASTELMAQDFFKPQPIKGARVYYLHWILHDWADDQAREILEMIVASMEPGYSRLVINDNIVPDQNCEYTVACLNLLMTVQVGSRERTELQWRELLNSVGLTEMSFHQPPGDGEGIIVAMRS
ncbi:S-adenosyl-L-methionine-dependent methyltransferase [Aspergillus undulatus]|uniref:S-adenosyl-L-methionine-dependent methyltransferase n=1 Tax=Aspergillus undulatus TaxID=1810928 RepID=UPI003CCCDEFF